MALAVITGPTGAVGIALVERLLREEYKVYAIVRPNSQRIQNLPVHPNLRIIECDLADLTSSKKEISTKCDVFYHLAWEGTTGIKRDDAYLQNQNIRYALDAVTLASDLKCTTFVGIGSQAEYGLTKETLSSITPEHPKTGYGIAKLCAGQLTRLLAKEKGIHHIWARLLSVYGPYDGESSMIMAAITKMLRGERVQFTKGEQLWDFLYSADAAEALFLLGIKGINGKTYCVGTGTCKPLIEYIQTMHELVNPSAEIGIGEIPYSENQVMNLCADISDLQRDTGFCPKIKFNKGISEVVKHILRSNT